MYSKLSFSRSIIGFTVTVGEFAPGTVSLTGDWTQGNESKQKSNSNL